MAEALIKQYLNDYFSRRDSSFWEPRKGIYHASAAGQCLRKTYYRHVLGPREQSDSYPNFWRGNMVEDLIARALRAEYGYRHVRNSIPIQVAIDDFEIKGETDLVLMGANGEIEKLFEIKSTAERGFTYREDKPSKHHVYQVHSYMKGLGLDSCEIIYVSVPELREAHHIVDFNPRSWAAIVRRMRELHHCTMREEPPPAKPFAGWECDYCEYRAECKGEGGQNE